MANCRDLRQVPEDEVPGAGVVLLARVRLFLVKIHRHDLHSVLGQDFSELGSFSGYIFSVKVK